MVWDGYFVPSFQLMCSGDKEREGMEDCPRIKKGGTEV